MSILVQKKKSITEKCLKSNSFYKNNSKKKKQTKKPQAKREQKPNRPTIQPNTKPNQNKTKKAQSLCPGDKIICYYLSVRRNLKHLLTFPHLPL